MKNNLLVFRILLIAITCISIIIFLLLYLFQYNSQQNNIGCGTKSPSIVFCGTSNSPLTGDPSKGKAIFNSNCAACHKLDAKATGPALRNTDSSTVFKWLTIKNQKINEQKFEQLGIDYHRSMWNKLFTKEDIKNLNVYITQMCKTH